MIDTEDLDWTAPWFLAGYLSSIDGGRQAERVGSSLGGGVRLGPRPVRLPLPPVEVQREYGEAFRRLAEFSRTLRAAGEAGVELARNSVDAIVTEMMAATGPPGCGRPAKEETGER